MSTPDSRSTTRAPTEPRKALRTIPLPRAAADPRVSPYFSFSVTSSEQRSQNLPPERAVASWSRSPTPGCAGYGAEWLRAHGTPGLDGLGAPTPGHRDTGTAYLLTSARGSRRPRRRQHRAPALRGRAAFGRPLSPAAAAAQPARQPQVASPRESRPHSRAPRLPSPAPRPRPRRQPLAAAPAPPAAPRSSRSSALLRALLLLLARATRGSGRVSPPPSASPVSFFLLPLLLLKQILWPQIATRLPPLSASLRFLSSFPQK